LNTGDDIPRLVRERTGLSQEKFAAKVGANSRTVSMWENILAKPSLLALKQIEDLLHDLGIRGRDLLEDNFGEDK
jgi:putative transcriptional regulator